MKAIVSKKYGPPEVLEIKEVEKPLPKENEVLIKIFSATVNAGDCETRSFKIAPLFWIPIRLYMGILKPRIKILGQEFAGEIESVGENVTRFKKGEQVFGVTKMRLGAYAEYVCLPDNYPIIIKPKNISYEHAAAIPVGGLNALHFLNKANIKPNQTVLINGAGGSIGTYAVQIAKLSGAEITAVDSTNKLEMLLSIGADYVIDYTQKDFSKNGKKYDIIFDVAGKSSFSCIIKSLKKNGYSLFANPKLFQMIRGLWISRINKKNVITGVADEKIEDLNILKDLIETGKLKPVIDRIFPMEQIIEAHRYVETGLKKGNVVITFNHKNN